MNRYFDLCQNHPAVAAYIDQAGFRVKLDIDLLKDIMLKIEALDAQRPVAIIMDGRDPIAVARHIEMLYDAGLIEGISHAHYGTAIKDILVKDMSLRGHQFLASMRDENIWSKIKASLSPSAIAGLTVSQLVDLSSELGMQAARKALGLE